jgi:hypothetical protein
LGQTKDYKIDICCFIARSIKEKEQRLIGPESEYYEAHHSSTNLTNLKENLEINCI